jgi:putative spermidine/putrescine transport system substrate-binding protein
MRRGRRRPLPLLGLACLLVALVLPAEGLTRPSAAPLPDSVGKGEGELSLLALPGYTDKKWLTPFERKTGCTVSVRTSSLADEITTVMTSGGTGIDVVSAPGDAAQRLIAAGDVAPLNVKLVPGWKDFHAAFRNAQTNTVGGRHYGISALFAPNLLLYDSKRTARPRSWSVLYNPKNRGQVTVPDDPMFIADAALYLSSTRPGLGIHDPYELSQAQLNAVVQLLRNQRPLISDYWPTASDEVALFKSRNAVVGPGWPYQLDLLRKARPSVHGVVPKEGITGWLDSWMVSVRSKHPNCAYRWLAYVSTPKVQAELATSYGATPVNTKACAAMDKSEARSCTLYRANAPDSFFRRVSLWKAPISACGDDRGSTCQPYAAWVRAWADLKKS